MSRRIATQQFQVGHDIFEILTHPNNFFKYCFIAHSVYTKCTRKITKLFLKPISINIYTMEQVEVSNMYIDMNVNSGSEK